MTTTVADTKSDSMTDLCWKWNGHDVDIMFGVRGWVLYTPIAVPGSRPRPENGCFERLFGFGVTRDYIEQFAKDHLK